MPRDGFNFRNREAFSQWRGIFAAAKWGGRLRNGTHVPKGGFTAAKPPTKWVFGCENWSFKALGISQPISQLRNEGGGCEMALVCQGVVLQLRNFSQRRGMGLRNHFATKGRFRSQWAFSQPRPDFATCFLGLQNYFIAKSHFRKGFLWAAKSRRPWIFPCFWTFFLLQATFLQFLCNSS